MLQYLGNFIQVCALMWAIYAFFIKARQEAADKDRKDMIDVYKESKQNLEKEMNSLRAVIDTQKKEFEEMKVKSAQQSERLKIHDELMKENYRRMEKVLDRHETKLDDFGKVIIK